MRCDKNTMLLYAVTDRAWTKNKTLYEQVEEALRGGVTCVQLREKELPYVDFLSEAIKIRELCKKYGVPFIVNDNADVAVKCSADGIHVGQGDMELGDVRRIVGDNMIIGVSVHTVEEALKAVGGGADYLGVGAMFSTSTKADADVLSMETLYDICHAVSIPVVAIGGLNRDNILSLGGSGVDGVALVSAIFGAENIESECKELYHISKNMILRSMKTALTIAGSDSSGGAGIQADIKAMTVNGVYAMSAVTALTAQNTTGVSEIFSVTPGFLEKQIDMVFTDIRPDAVKIGMVSDAELIKIIADKLIYYKAKNIVADPVMIATSGADLIKSDGIDTMKKYLLPIADIVTPNIFEAEVLTGMRIENGNDMEKAAVYMNSEFGCAVLLKGGHSTGDANDLLCVNGELRWFFGERIRNPNTHGTGCTLSSAVAANLAKGYSLENSVKHAKEYITGTLSTQLNLGKGSGPVNHGFCLCGKFSGVGL